MIIRVSALYDWSRRVMAFLLFVGLAAVTNAAVSLFDSLYLGEVLADFKF